MSAQTGTLTDDQLTTAITARAKDQVARDFGTWLRTHGSDLLAGQSGTRKRYLTERALASFIARAVSTGGDYVARGALIEHASGLSDYIDHETFEMECVAALRKVDR